MNYDTEKPLSYTDFSLGLNLNPPKLHMQKLQGYIQSRIK